jgi:hypothetical protein
MRHVSVSAVLVLVFAVFLGSAHARATVQITACGQAVPRGAVGLLMNDLDCTGFVGGIANEAVSLAANAKLDLQGHTITGGLFGVGCYELCADGTGACSHDGSKCTIVNGTITGADASGIDADVVDVRNVTASNNGDSGVQGYRKARAHGSTLTGNGESGIRAWSVEVTSSTVTGNGQHGVAGSKYDNGRYTRGVTVRDSTVIGNGMSPDCVDAGRRCGDVLSGTRPKVRASTCNTSVSPFFVPGCGLHWCVCAVN